MWHGMQLGKLVGRFLQLGSDTAVDTVAPFPQRDRKVGRSVFFATMTDSANKTCLVAIRSIQSKFIQERRGKPPAQTFLVVSIDVIHYLCIPNIC